MPAPSLRDETFPRLREQRLEHGPTSITGFPTRTDEAALLTRNALHRPLARESLGGRWPVEEKASSVAMVSCSLTAMIPQIAESVSGQTICLNGRSQPHRFGLPFLCRVDGTAWRNVRSSRCNDPLSVIESSPGEETGKAHRSEKSVFLSRSRKMDQTLHVFCTEHPANSDRTITKSAHVRLRSHSGFDTHLPKLFSSLRVANGTLHCAGIAFRILSPTGPSTAVSFAFSCTPV